MAIEKNVKNLVINKLTRLQYKELVDTNAVKDDELYLIQDDLLTGDFANTSLNNLDAQGQAVLDAKQNKLTAGENVEIIEDGTINVTGVSGVAVWGEITGDIQSQTDLINFINSKIGGVFVYKGSVKTEALLPTELVEIGDVYNVESSGANFVWNGDDWDKLSDTINLENYVLKEEGKSLIATSEIKRLAGLENYDDTEIRDELATKQSRLTAGDNIIIDENGVISAIGSGGSGTIQAYTVRYDAATQTVIFGKSFIAEEDATV